MNNNKHETSANREVKDNQIYQNLHAYHCDPCQ